MNGTWPRELNKILNGIERFAKTQQTKRNSVDDIDESIEYIWGIMDFVNEKKIYT